MAIKLSSSAFVKDLVKRTKLVQHYESAWTDWDGPLTFTYESKESDDAFHPSGDCTPTSQALYHKALAKMAGEDPDPIGPTLRKTFLVGHFWHQVYQDLTVKELGFCTLEDVERKGQTGWGESYVHKVRHPKPHNYFYKPYHWARGSADIAPCRVPRHGEFLIDFKTQNSRDFARPYLPDWCKEKYEAQVNIYMDWFGLEKALIIGINKDSPHDLKEIEYHYNAPLVDAIYEKWHFVSECLVGEEEPTPADDEHFDLRGLYKGPIET